MKELMRIKLLLKSLLWNKVPDLDFWNTFLNFENPFPE